MPNNLMKARLGITSKPTTKKGLTPIKLGVPHKVEIRKGHIASKKK